MGAIASLILINGPPAVGKSTLARRYVDEHPLTLLVEIDAVRSSLGGWQENGESKLIARRLAVTLADAHLHDGYDVVVPQLVGRLEFIEELERLAQRTGARFVEIMLVDDETALLDRFRARRLELIATDQRHPEADVADDAIAGVIKEYVESLATVARARTHTAVISAAGGPDAAYVELVRRTRNGEA